MAIKKRTDSAAIPAATAYLVVAIGGLLISAQAFPAGAHAADLCTGDYVSTVIHPSPMPLVVALKLNGGSDASGALARDFRDGMRSVGQYVGDPASASLSVSYRILYRAVSGTRRVERSFGEPAGPDSGWSDWSGDNAPWLRGGETASLPDFPRYDMFHPRPPAQPDLLMLRAELRDTRSDALDWVGTVQCPLQGSDDQHLAYQLGTLTGKAMEADRDQTQRDVGRQIVRSK